MKVLWTCDLGKQESPQGSKKLAGWLLLEPPSLAFPAWCTVNLWEQLFILSKPSLPFVNSGAITGLLGPWAMAQCYWLQSRMSPFLSSICEVAEGRSFSIYLHEPDCVGGLAVLMAQERVIWWGTLFTAQCRMHPPNSPEYLPLGLEPDFQNAWLSQTLSYLLDFTSQTFWPRSRWWPQLGWGLGETVKLYVGRGAGRWILKSLPDVTDLWILKYAPLWGAMQHRSYNAKRENIVRKQCKGETLVT